MTAGGPPPEPVADVVEGGHAGRRGWRRAAAAVAVTTVAVTLAAAGPTALTRAHRAAAGSAAGPASPAREASAAPRAQGARAAVTAPVCPPSTTVAADGSGAYAVQVKADINDIHLFNGWNEQTQNWQSEVTNVTAKACGLLQIPSLQVTIAPSGLVFDTSHADIVTLIGDVPIFQPGDVAVRLTPTGPAVTTVTGVRPGSGELDLAASTPLRADVVNGATNPTEFDCVTTPAATLFTGRKTVLPTGRGPLGPTQPGRPDLPRWTVEGTPLSGPIVGAQALVVSNDFPLPIFPATGTCANFADLFNSVFSGQKATGGPYFTGAPYGPAHPPGAAWVTGTLQITALDPSALQVGPPATVPGTS